MRTRTLHRTVLWLLPLLAVRLFLPIGFMVTTDGPGLRLALCPSYAPLPTASGAAAPHVHHAGMDHSSHGTQSDDPGPPANHDHETSAQSHCPFALAGSAAVCVADLRFTGLEATEVLGDLRTEPAWTVPAVLIDRIRGPPLA